MDDVQQFTSRLSSDPEFANRIKGAMTAREITLIAKSEGMTLTDADIAKAIAQGSSELTDEELQSVSVGTPMAAALIK
ncbi:MAG TPA: Nif11-like leader peptide family RiPP precursor [Allosphingosinicella sp.]|nr:Nif11-like leader peptide family RiPP precursor [Allosphingosinicella sp.]